MGATKADIRHKSSLTIACSAFVEVILSQCHHGRLKTERLPCFNTLLTFRAAYCCYNEMYRKSILCVFKY